MAVLRWKSGEVFVGGREIRAALLRSGVLLMLVMADCAMSSAQGGSCAPASGSDKQEQPTQSTDQSKDPAKKDSDSQDAGKNGQTAQPDHQGVMNTMNSTVNATVDSVRRLPAQWFLGTYVPANQDLKPLTMVERRDVYIRQTYLTGASYLKRMFGAGIDQARGAPSEWGGGLEGYGKRFASRYGQFILQNSLAAAGNAWLGYEPRYDYCKCTGFWPRTKHAIARNFVTYNHTEIEQRPQIPLYVGAFSAGVIAAETWRPEKESALKGGAYSAASQAGFGVLSNWLQEFALDIGHKITPKRRRQGPTGIGPTPTGTGTKSDQ